MKTPFLFILLFNLNILTTYSQAPVCKTPKENNFDVNEISIKKCDINKKKDNNVREIAKKANITTRKRVSNRLRKNSNHLNKNKNFIDLKVEKSLKIPNLSREVLFTLVEKIPMFESCDNSSRENNVKCFKSKMNDHFSKNFYLNNFIDENIEDKIYIQFSIDLHGKVINSKIKSSKENKELNKELNRIVEKLPRFLPGKQKGLPVIVTYSFPLNLTS
ncbi:energy transducer TonB [Tenacibaculum aestuariivivum]|uniref:energy transducer TonB n=1 Tax=Tenacibaculum aestuariivivum TaxID=2006131 RepID=UPI003AB63178